jgi:hypothetical protein
MNGSYHIVKKLQDFLGDTAPVSTWIYLSQEYILTSSTIYGTNQGRRQKNKFLLKCYVLCPYLFLEFISRN